MTRRQSLRLSGCILAAGLVTLAGIPHLAGQTGGAAPIASRASTLPPLGTNITITEADCSAAKLGTSIPTSAIGEPVSAVTLNAPVWTPATDTAPAVCVVDGSMAPVDRAPTARPINFRVMLPASWNHRASQKGGGGMNGSVPLMGAVDRDLGAGVAQYGSDSGHQNATGPGGRGRVAGPPTGPDAEWALNDEAIRNLGFAQLKKTHDAAFVVIERMYGERPRFSYFVGTSQGGREALTVVQRYPADYDGVLAIVPIVNFSTLMLGPELIRIHEKPAANWVPPAKVEAIRAEFLRQCDTLDGAIDGLINNYAGCRATFNVKTGAPNRHPWASKRCPNNIDPNPADTTPTACLTDGQISTLEMTYSPYRFPTPLAYGTTQFGMWVPTISPSGSGLIVGQRFDGQEGAAPGASKHSHLGVLGVTAWLQQDLQANPLDFTESAYAARRKQISEWADSTNPDLRAFYRRGGKLVVQISAQDTLASPGAQLDYYQSVLDTMGRATVDAFARLYVLPQGDHGSAQVTAPIDGNGAKLASTPLPSAWNRGAALMAWVEQNTPPAKSVVMTLGDQSLPLCSYPEYPRYVSGPALRAASYTCTPSQPGR